MAKRKKGGRFKTASQTRRAASAQPAVVHLLSYEVTNEVMHDERYPHLPADLVERLHDLVLTQPKAAIPEVMEEIGRHPDVPTLYNYLAVACGQSGEVAKYEQTVLENFRRFPDYLFARLNYAELLLSKRDYGQVANLLNHAFDIGLFYPQRKRFHITEYTGFMGVVGLYHVGVGDLAAAQKAVDALKQVAPDAPITRRLLAELQLARTELLLAALKRKMLSDASPSR